MIKKFRSKFDEFINKWNDFLVVHHYDTDGICSASLVSIALEIRGKKYKNLSLSQYDEDGWRMVLKHSSKYKNAIFLDLASINRNIIEAFERVMIIDHHQLKNYPNYVVYINPRLKNSNVYIPCSYIIEKILNLKEFRWIGIVGTIGDMGFDLLKKFNISEKNWKKTKLGKIAMVIDSVKVIGGKKACEKIVKFIAKSNSPNDVLKNYGKFYIKYKKELLRLIKDFKRNKKVINDFIIYRIFSKYNFSSTLATILSRKFKNKTLVISQKEKNGSIKVSLRSSRLDLTDFLDKVLKDIKATYGGHPQASGITFSNEKEFSRFLEKIKSFYS
ncbi:MAG: DHHA1 domain-containing protein [Candidatus Aenigmarchaeota archaeon]|nr:DHHA1 domain-containing protein [Candidatus Aenigmarchaeota archaeon]MDW8149304.1 DHHA1 domain-containing protein [Candidatus Aenigmarchaeota archaeon]